MDTYQYIARLSILWKPISHLQSFRKGLDACQVAFVVRKFKQHCQVGTVAEVLESIKLQEE
jgi:hypothetical protein